MSKSKDSLNLHFSNIILTGTHMSYSFSYHFPHLLNPSSSHGLPAGPPLRRRPSQRPALLALAVLSVLRRRRQRKVQGGDAGKPCLHLLLFRCGPIDFLQPPCSLPVATSAPLFPRYKSKFLLLCWCYGSVCRHGFRF